MAARNWGSLSREYRERLARKGVTQARYESGASLAGARGHGQTPERPERAETTKGQAKYQAYLSRRKQLQDDLIVKKERVFGGSHKWNPASSMEYVRDKIIGKERPTITDMKRALAMTDQEMEDAADATGGRWEGERWWFFFYH
jgi:hypothetical protein